MLVQKIDELQFRLELVLENQIALKKNHLNQLYQNLKQIPLAYKIVIENKQLLEKTSRIKKNMFFLLQNKYNQLLQLTQELKSYNPSHFLKQGYFRICDRKGNSQYFSATGLSFGGIRGFYRYTKKSIKKGSIFLGKKFWYSCLA